MTDTKFKPGQSGNPAGRRPGATAGAKIRAAIEERKDEILKAVIDAAIAGDMQACKMLLDRITPPLKPIAQPVIVPDDGINTLAGRAAKVVSATLAGQIPPDIGNQLITALAAQAKITEIDELTRRVEILESKHNPER
jgi:hypothetical protein